MNSCKEIFSLCKVWIDSSNTIWLNRLADVDKDKLVVPDINPDKPKQFYNRDRLYWRNGPNAEGSLGVWKWKAVPSDNDFDRDHIISDYQKDINPVRVVVVPDIQSMDDLVDKLKSRVVWTKPLICDTLFCYKIEWGHFDGVLCRSDEFTVQDQYVTMCKDLYLLPCYSISISDIYNWDEKSLRFIKSIALGEPNDYVSIGDIRDLIKRVILSRMSWPAFKEVIGRTRADWHECQKLFETVCADSVYDELLKKSKCPASYIKSQLEAFVSHSKHSFEVGDIDSEIIAHIAMNHDGLRAQCEAAIEEHWQASHAKAIAAAQKELDQKKQAAENIVNEYKTQFEKIQADQKTAEANFQTILAKTADAQANLNHLLREIDEYEALGTNTVQAIRDKIGSAQQDMAGFIAELSTFMPQQSEWRSSICDTKPANRWPFIHGVVYSNTDSTEECSSWRDTLVLLWDNLQLAGVGSKWLDILSAFLYSAYLNHMPLLLAGPNAEAIADALSMTICGKRIDILKCCGEQDAEAISNFVESDMAAVQNPFHPDLISCIPHSNNGFALWLHPFTEDLQIEPRSLYHYAYPVFTECFVDQLPSAENMDAGQETDAYDEFKPDPKYRAKMGPVKRLGMCRLMTNRLEKVLEDAKCMAAMSDDSMEYLFGILPMCVLSGKQDILAELLDSEKNIKPEVKTELQRYIEE